MAYQCAFITFRVGQNFKAPVILTYYCSFGISTNGASNWTARQRVFCKWKVFHHFSKSLLNWSSKQVIILLGIQRISKLQSKVKIKIYQRKIPYFFDGNIFKKSLCINIIILASLLVVLNGYPKKKIVACRKIKSSSL